MHVSRTQYHVLFTLGNWHVVRPSLDGGFIVAGPFNTEYEAECEARRRSGSRSAMRRAA